MRFLLDSLVQYAIDVVSVAGAEDLEGLEEALEVREVVIAVRAHNHG